GNSELSVQLADRAAKLPPLPLLDGTDNMSPRSREQSRKTHRQIAGSLSGRGLFEWAEREYRLVIQSAPMNDPTAMGCRIEMLEMLGDLERHADAIAIIQPLLDRISRDDETRGRFMQFANYAEDQLRGLYLFHRAETEIAADKLEKARASLTNGFRLFPENIDILIRMYRVDGDEKWKTIVDAKLRTLIAGYEAQLNLQPGAAAILGSSQRRLLAANCNQYAWLVSNTRGDFRRALEAGKLAVKLDPGYANLDTLARCYYALGRYDEALATQRQAIELEPHSPPLQRQLKLIETAREQTKSESAKPEPAKPERSK
ncbi:MAG: tetratricopeptide repeat protein, partial [Planctomycetota bacterium]